MKTIFFIAGESSGDMHGANLIRALQAADPEVRCFGLGGTRMAGAGMELVHDLAADAIMGFVEVLRKALPIRRLFLDTVALVRERRPDCIVLIDYPGFNIRFAEAVRDLGIPVVYYISPQVWAWKRKRIDRLARVVRKMLVILPFEEAMYRDKGVYSIYVGHPLVDEIARYAPEAEEKEKAVVALLPGSRAQEIHRIAPVMAQVCRDMLAVRPDLRFMTSCVSEARAEQVRAAFAGLPVDIRIGGTYDILAQSRCCLVASGTATLETALFETPMAIVYRVNPVSYWLARLLVRIRHIGIVNIIAGRELVPEFIQQNAVSERITPFLLELLDEGPRRKRMLQDFRELKSRLGGPGASERAAGEILGVMELSHGETGI